MRYRVVFGTIGWLIFLLSFSMAFLMMVGLVLRDDTDLIINAFGIPFVITILSGLFLMLGTGSIMWLVRPAEEMRDREGLFVVGAGWLIIAIFGALPFYFGTQFYGGVNRLDMASAFFESMSGFTTTGASVLSADCSGLAGTALAGCRFDLPRSLLLWRSFIQWLGGMGIIVLSVVILSRFVGGGMQLLRAEVPGVSVTKLTPRIAQTGSLLWKIYLGFTVVEFLLLWGLMWTGTGDRTTWFDALNHAFTTLATGGYSTNGKSVEGYADLGMQGILIHLVIIVFMFIAGTNFVLHYHAFLRKDWKTMWGDPEFRMYMVIVAGSTGLIAINLLSAQIYTEPGETLMHALFQSVSLTTTTGYSSTDFNTWPLFSKFILFMLMFVGGMAGSTGGGVKTVRWMILAKNAKREITRVIHPRAVLHVHLGKLKIDDETVQGVTVFFYIYILIFFFGTLVMLPLMPQVDADGNALSDESQIVSSITATISAISNVGPGLATVGPAMNYASVHTLGKVFLSILMWFGRLELYAAIILFFPATYRS